MSIHYSPDQGSATYGTPHDGPTSAFNFFCYFWWVLETQRTPVPQCAAVSPASHFTHTRSGGNLMSAFFPHMSLLQPKLRVNKPRQQCHPAHLITGHVQIGTPCPKGCRPLVQTILLILLRPCFLTIYDFTVWSEITIERIINRNCLFLLKNNSALLLD